MKRFMILWGALALGAVVPGTLGCPGEPGGPGDGDGDRDTEEPTPQTRFPRLSHDQWERSVRDLLFLPDDTTYAAGLRNDPNAGGTIFVHHGDLRVDQALWQGYQQVAEDVARDVAADPALLDALIPATSGTEDARIDRFIRTHGTRAHRRPLTDAQVEAYRALFAAAPTMYPSGEGLTPLAAGVRVVVEAWLQSPYFLYRPELSVDGAGSRIPLDGYEMASRLSYALWGTMPDQALLDAAGTGQLATKDGVAQQAERLLQSPRAARVVEDFHVRLFDVASYALVQPPPALGASADFGQALAEEHRRLVTDLFETDGGLEGLLTTNRTFVNAELADVYGLEGTFPDDDFAPAELDPETRRGVLTMAGFLARNAAGGSPDPIHRGVFISDRLACNDVPAPPDTIPPYPVAEGQTNRQLVETLTEGAGTNCRECHATIINPFGFPFENYDALGRYITEDNGFAIDASSSLLLGTENVSVQNGVELAEALATSGAVHACYAGHWLDFLYGRELDEDIDSPLVGRVADMSLSEHASIASLIVGLVTSDAFRHRSTTEEL